MEFDNTYVRRQDRLLDEERSLDLLRDGEYGVLSLGETQEDEGGYGIPINYVMDGDVIWFHSALEGRKLRRIGSCSQASFCVVGVTRLQPDKFSTLYESVVVTGNIKLVSDDEQKRQALRLLIAKYSPDYIKEGAKYTEHSFQRTSILRLKIDRLSGKAKKM